MAITQKMRNTIFRRDKNRCLKCTQVNMKHNPLTLDHIVPKSLGGGDIEINLQTLCKRCNNNKGNQIIHTVNDMTTQEIQKRADAVTTGAAVEHLGFELDSDGCFPANEQRIDDFIVTVRGMRVALHTFEATDCEPASEYAYRVERMNGIENFDVGHTRFDTLEEAINALPQ